MRLIRSSAFVLASVFAASIASGQSAPVSILFQNGNVTVRTTARTPLRTVLQEWARVGKAKIVNAENVSVTLEQIELVNVPEQQALSILLRDVSGYAVGARELATSGPSRFDRIMLLPRSTGSTTPQRQATVLSNVPPPALAFVPGDPNDDPNDAVTLTRRLTPGQANAGVAAARDAAAAAAQNSDRNPSENAQRPAPTTTAPGLFTGRGGRPGEIAPVPQQPQRNPLRPNGDPEP